MEPKKYSKDIFFLTCEKRAKRGWGKCRSSRPVHPDLDCDGRELLPASGGAAGASANRGGDSVFPIRLAVWARWIQEAFTAALGRGGIEAQGMCSRPVRAARAGGFRFRWLSMLELFDRPSIRPREDIWRMRKEAGLLSGLIPPRSSSHPKPRPSV